MKRIKNIIRQLPEKYWAWQLFRIYSKQFKRYLQMHNIANVPEKGENEYIKYWSQLTDRIEPYSYRLFSRFCGNSHWIVPEDIGHSIIERRLNPKIYEGFLSDKNLFATYLHPTECLPQTLLCRISGGPLLNKEFTPPIYK